MIKTVAVAGSGGQAYKYLHYFSEKPSFAIAGVTCSAEERRGGISRDFHCRTYATIQDLLGAERVDLLVVASKPNQHGSDVSAALARGVPDIIIEKPLTRTPEAAAALREEIRSAKSNVSVCYPLRFSKAYKAVQQMLQTKKYGPLKHILAHISFPRSLNTDRYPHSWWVNKDISGGGTIFQVGIHWINFIFSLVDYNITELQGCSFNNDFNIDDTLFGTWLFDAACGKGSAVLALTSSVQTPCAHIVFGFEHNDVVFWNGDLIIIDRSIRERFFFNAARAPIQMLGRIMKKKKSIVLNYLSGDSLDPFEVYLNETLSSFSKSSVAEFLSDAVEDIKIIKNITDNKVLRWDITEQQRPEELY